MDDVAQVPQLPECDQAIIDRLKDIEAVIDDAKYLLADCKNLLDDVRMTMDIVARQIHIRRIAKAASK